MLTVYQEMIPFSNKKYKNQISKDASYTNPIIMPFVLNATGQENILETVMYIKNDSLEHYYKDIVVCLMKEDNSSNPMESTGIITTPGNGIYNFSVNSTLDIISEVAFEYSNQTTGSTFLINKYMSNYSIVTDDDDISVKFSFGYDQISPSSWSDRKSVLIIPYIGTQGLADTSYIPIRIRINWKKQASIFTIRDYFIDVSYGSEISIVS